MSGQDGVGGGRGWPWARAGCRGAWDGGLGVGKRASWIELRWQLPSNGVTATGERKGMVGCIPLAQFCVGPAWGGRSLSGGPGGSGAWRQGRYCLCLLCVTPSPPPLGTTLEKSTELVGGGLRVDGLASGETRTRPPRSPGPRAVRLMVASHARPAFPQFLARWLVFVGTQTCSRSRRSTYAQACSFEALGALVREQSRGGHYRPSFCSCLNSVSCRLVPHWTRRALHWLPAKISAHNWLRHCWQPLSHLPTTSETLTTDEWVIDFINGPAE